MNSIMGPIKIFPNKDVSYLDSELLSNGLLIVKDASFYKNIHQDDLSLWCHINGVYSLPTTELINWLKDQVVPGKTIEVGAGMGTTGRALGIPITDSCIMENPAVAAYYKFVNQPVTKYPSDIIRIDGVSAVRKYKPSVVIGSWVTQIYREEDGASQASSVYGFDEDFIIDNVDKYIVIGNERTHGDKRIMRSGNYKEHYFDWLFSRSIHSDGNVIYVWEK